MKTEYYKLMIQDVNFPEHFYPETDACGGEVKYELLGSALDQKDYFPADSVKIIKVTEEEVDA